MPGGVRAGGAETIVRMLQQDFPAWSAPEPMLGAFYAYPSVKGVLFKKSAAAGGPQT